jgi:glycosyltransferase involved in cell wall biosynthesis
MIFFNFVPIQAGGGVQNALSFLHSLSETGLWENRYIIVCIRGGFIHEFCVKKRLRHRTIPAGALSRVWYEFYYGWCLAKKFNATLVFSLFGGAPIVSPGLYKISGFAYSNIIQREVPFWNFLPPKKRMVKRVTDKLRLYLATKSAEIIVETGYLAERAKKTVFRDSVVHVVNMSPSSYFLECLAGSSPLPVAYSAKFSADSIKILYLSGPHPNKRIHLLAEVLALLGGRARKYQLVTTLPADSAYFQLVLDHFQQAGASDMLVNIGPVSPENVASILKAVDGVINVALLESFSNNWVEAWAARKPLIVTKAEWARSSCGDAAAYIDPNDAQSAADAIVEVFELDKHKSDLLVEGVKKLESLPSPAKKFEMYAAIINAALEIEEMQS